MNNDIMTIKELSAYLKINQKTLYKLVKLGKLPGIKIGGMWRFKKEAIDTWMSNSRATSYEAGKMTLIEDLSLKVNEKNALQAFKEMLLKRFSDAEIILYGSKVRGDYDKESDIDLLVLLESPVTTAIEEEVFHISYEIELKYDVVFGILVHARDFWNSDLANAMPIHWNIDKEGITV